jgi:hypothetical protein
MTAAARISRRTLMDRLFLEGMEWTDANPWFGLIGLALTMIVCGVMEGLLP